MTTAASSAFASAFNALGANAVGGGRFARDVARVEGCAGFALTITEGVHEGARLRARRCMTVGSAEQDDLVLRDPGVDPRHAEIARLNGVWVLLCDNEAGTTRPLAPIETLRRGRFLRQRYRLGGATLVLTQAAPPPGHLLFNLGRNRKIWWRPEVLWPAFAVAFCLTVGVAWFASHARAVAPLPDEQTLIAQGWPDVKLGPDGQGGFLVSGYVDDEVQLEQMRQWFANQSAVKPLSWRVRMGTDSATLVQQALNTEGVSVSYRGAGHVRVQGTVSDMAVRERLRRVAADLAGVVQIDDHLAVVDTQASAPKMRPLPFRIMDVVPGPSGYFRTDTGGLYFVGAVLSDGAEVVAISADEIEFQLGERRVYYNLK